MVSSARNPNESYAQRAKKANSSSSSSPPQTQNNQPNPLPSSSKPPQVNVWAERIKEQKAHAAQMPPHRATSPPQPPGDDPIQPRLSSPDLSTQLAILDQQDEHDPFVVRVPPHLSRQSSSSTNPHPTADPTAWPHLPGATGAASASHDSPFLSAAPSRQNSTASFRHHAYSSSGSVRLSRVQSSLSQHSHSASQSRTQSRSGSSASSPRLQIRGRTLPHDDSLPPDLRLDNQHRKASNQRSSPALPDPPNNTSTTFQADTIPPADHPYYPRPLVPPLQDMSPRYAHHFVPHYALTPQFSPNHVSGHTSPPYIPHSGQGTPPYPHYPPYPAYMYGHSPLFWDVPPPHSHSHFQNQHFIPSNFTSASEHIVSHSTELGSISPPVTVESDASKNAAPGHANWQPKSSKNVVFGTINLAESPADLSAPSTSEEQQPSDTAVERATEQFASFSIGMTPNEAALSRLGSRRPSVRSLSKMLFSQPTTNDAKGANAAPLPSRETNGIKKPIKWEFGTTHSEDLDDARPPSSPPPNHHDESSVDGVDGQLDSANVPPSRDASQSDRSADKSAADSPASDVWVVKDFGYGFGEQSNGAIAADVGRWEAREHEKQRAREVSRDHHRDRSWTAPRQQGWRSENGSEDARDGWEQQGHTDVPRHGRLRRGSFPGYGSGGHERGGFAVRRGRGFGGRYYGGRGRGFYHQRPGSYPFVPPAPPPPPPPPPLAFEMPPSAIDMPNGYGPPAYTPPEFESYEAFAHASQTYAPFTSAAYSIDAMRLLGQLEYYLSPQNMAQDLYLRQRMDKEGWIPISLLASFKRVQQLHTDASIVREVLSRSRMVEVNGEWVRMGAKQWEPFVLPNAPRSAVTRVDRDGDEPRSVPYHDGDADTDPGEVDGEHGETDGDCDGEDCDGDDEDDDIEFVIGEEAEGSWMSVVERKQ